ncbi:RsmD family RNA methyltransferase [candidate division WOR-3 bacterium]|nr:RsmD family RNA methyltransferase [candidate division WOR-3 bacterium]
MPKGTRIVAGSLKNRIVEGVGEGVRPMTAYMRKRMFDKLSDSIFGLSALDLFSGSGSIGFEALSRGCKDVLFVEKDSRRAGYILERARKWSIVEKVKVVKADVMSLKWNTKFSLIFVDPPYAFKDTENLAKRILNLSENGGTVIWHSNDRINLAGIFRLFDLISHGGKTLYFFEVLNEE